VARSGVPPGRGPPQTVKSPAAGGVHARSPCAAGRHRHGGSQPRGTRSRRLPAGRASPSPAPRTARRRRTPVAAVSRGRRNTSLIRRDVAGGTTMDTTTTSPLIDRLGSMDFAQRLAAVRRNAASPSRHTGSRSRGRDGEGSAASGAHPACDGCGADGVQRMAAGCRSRAGRGTGRACAPQGVADGRRSAGPVGSAASVSAGPGRRGLRGAGAVDQHARVGRGLGRHVRRQSCVPVGRQKRCHAAVDPFRALGRRAGHGARGVPRGVGAHSEPASRGHPRDERGGRGQDCRGPGRRHRSP
jgi:hypothetical protein